MKDTNCLTAEMLIENEPSSYNIFKSDAVMTGFKDLDDITEGFLPGELICIAGRNSMGATGLALSILNRVCIRDRKHCLYFALAEDARSILSRLIANVSNKPDIFRPEHEDELKETLRKIEKSPFSINETAYFVDSIERTCEKQISKAPVDLVIVDYHQLIKIGKEDRSLISVHLKKLARSIKYPIIVLCQLDQSIDRRDDRRPLLSDLGSVGEMNHYADKVLLMYREDYYNTDTKNAAILQILVAKNNYAGRVGKVELLHKGGGIFVDIPKKHNNHHSRIHIEDDPKE